jgi:hypothetical protein
VAFDDKGGRACRKRVSSFGTGPAFRLRRKAGTLPGRSVKEKNQRPRQPVWAVNSRGGQAGVRADRRHHRRELRIKTARIRLTSPEVPTRTRLARPGPTALESFGVSPRILCMPIPHVAFSRGFSTLLRRLLQSRRLRLTLRSASDSRDPEVERRGHQ